jgi:hypothetical protein
MALKRGSAVALAAGVLMAWPLSDAGAQQASPADLQALSKQMEEMRRDYDRQIQDMKRNYEARMSEMEQRLQSAETTATGADKTASAAQETAKQALDQPVQTASAPASASSFNPAMSLILNGAFAKMSKEPESWNVPGFATGDEAQPISRGFSIGETELGLSANVDDKLYGQATISFQNDNTLEVEEAYIQSLSLPYGFTAKGGRFFSAVGYLNSFHAHAWDFYDAPLPYQVFLNTQYDDDGVQLRWQAPISTVMLEFGGEAFLGDSFPASGAVNQGVGSYSAFAKAGGDFNASHSWLAGVSELWTNAENRSTNDDSLLFTGRTNMTIFDAIYKWAPNGDPSRTNFKLQAEYFLVHNAGTYNNEPYDGNPTGWYAQAIYQFAPRWATGFRYDALSPTAVPSSLAATQLNPMGISPRRYTGMLQYTTSEFGRFRLQYTRDDSYGGAGGNQYVLQYTVSLGTHGAHSY